MDGSELRAAGLGLNVVGADGGESLRVVSRRGMRS